MAHAGPGDEYSPAMEAFLTRVQELGEITSHEEAARVTRGTLGTLAESISGGQMDGLAPGLPFDLRGEIDEARGHARRFDKGEFLDRLTGMIATVDTDRAERQARAVLHTLYERAPEGAIDDTLAQLPPELSRMFGYSDRA